MTNKEIRQLTKKELLEIIIEQSKEIKNLRELLQKFKNELHDKRIKIEQSGTMAEAAERLNGVFQAADKAAEQYIENARLNEIESNKLLADAQMQAAEIITTAEKIKNQKIEEADLYWAEIMDSVQYYMEKNPENK